MKISRTSLYCCFLISIFMAALYFLPHLLNRRNFEVPVPPSKPLGKFLVDKKFKVISGLASQKEVTLSELMGEEQTLIVNFWATWCAPCLDELAPLEYLNRQLSSVENKKIPRLITISVDEEADDITTLYKTLDFAPSFTVLHDPGGDFSRSMGTTKFPETYWINKSGEILYQWIGPQDWISELVLKRLSRILPNKTSG